MESIFLTMNDMLIYNIADSPDICRFCPTTCPSFNPAGPDKRSFFN